MSRLPQHRLLLGSCAAGLVLALAAAVLLPGRSAPPPGVQAPLSSPDAGSATAEAPWQRAWNVGNWYRYALRGSSSLRFRSATPGARLPPPMRFQLEGEWRVGVCSGSGEHREVQISFSPSTFSVEVDGQQTLAPQVRGAMLEALATPFFVTFDPGGAARLIHFEPRVDLLTQGLLRSLVAATQVVLPSRLSASWEAQEEDGPGLYLARYQLQSPLQLEKTRLRYTHLVTDEGLQPVDARLRVQVHSRTQLTLARQDLWPESLQGSETVEVDSGPDMIIPSSDNRVDLRLTERGTDGSLAVAFQARRPSLLSLHMASPQPLQEMDPLATYRQTLAGRSLKDFVRDLRSLPAEREARDKARNQALDGLVALFILEPATASQIPALLRTGLEPLAASPLLGALSSASTPETLRALCEIVGDTSLDPGVRDNAAGALGLASSPTQEGLSALRRLALGSDVTLRETALLGLGSAASNLRGTDARAADALLQELNSSLAGATTPQEQSILLLALGNTADPAAFASLQLFLSSREPEVRSAAVEALRTMPAPQADTLLSERMVSDESPDVRHSAVFAASARSLEPFFPAFRRVLQADTSSAVRAVLVQSLGAAVNTSPQARRLLTWSSQHDPEDSIRRDAAALLLSPTP